MSRFPSWVLAPGLFQTVRPQLPKSSNLDHIRSNVQLDFTISDEDMAMLAGIGQDYGADSWFPVFSGKKQV